MGKEKIKCLICNQQTNLHIESFGRWHLDRYHQITTIEYYNKFKKKENEGCCKICGETTKFISYNQGYLKYCSTKCLASDDETKNSIKDTKITRYGNENFNNRKKAEKTNIIKYGKINVSQVEEFKEKKIATSKKNFGTDYPTQSKQIKDKTKNTLVEKYGADNPSKVPEFSEKIKQTNILRYGEDHFSKTLQYRKLQEELGRWIPLEHKTDFDIYFMLVWKETDKWKKEIFENWNGLCYYTGIPLETDKEKFNEPNYATIEHKISIFEGYRKKIEYLKIGNIENLCICSRITNSIKGIRSEKQLKKILKNKKWDLT